MEKPETTIDDLPDGVKPRPPISPAQRSDKISPYRLGITSTSYIVGSCTMFKHTLKVKQHLL